LEQVLEAPFTEGINSTNSTHDITATRDTKEMANSSPSTKESKTITAKTDTTTTETNTDPSDLDRAPILENTELKTDTTMVTTMATILTISGMPNMVADTAGLMVGFIKYF